MECPICGGTSFLQRPGVVRDNPELKILECENCGLVRLSSFDHVRPGFYESGGMHTGEAVDIQTWLRWAEEDDERRFQQFRQNIKGKVIVDFGCGAGGFLLRARNEASRCYGVEVEQVLKKHFAEHELAVYPSLEELPEKADIIFMFHVLEHLAEPLAVLKKIKRMGARLVIEVPNAEDALLTLYKSDAFSRFTYWSPHLFLYNQYTLPKLCAAAGFQTVYVKQYQRYTLANHLYWLARGRPGGHREWSFLDNRLLNDSYAATLASLGRCDTLIAEFM